MATEFTPIFLLILVGISVAIGMFAASALLGPRKKTRVKLMPYESGMDPIGDARQRFDVRYYLVAIAFLLFDVELLYLYPWAVAQWSYEAPAAVASTARAPPAATAHPPAGNGGGKLSPRPDAVRHRLLRDRVEGRRRQPVRHRPLRRRGDAVQPPPVRPDDRRRPGGDEDDAGAPADLAPDARAQVVH